ncbi:MAG TPA: TIM barrel protein [Phycisphaerales bacterium]|nr:TIM barrel protein [Phycisphaerales bacterium]
MLLTLAASSLRALLAPDRSGNARLRLADLPRYAREELGLFGLNFSTALLAGSDYESLDRLREAADRAACPCLVLVESEPLDFASEDDDLAEAAVERLVRVARAASRLGCNSASVMLGGVTDEPGVDRSVERLKQVIRVADRLELNILLMSASGLTADPDSLTALIKRIGGFRIGTMPDFELAGLAPDPVLYLRRLTPYAAAVTAATRRGKPVKKAGGPDEIAELARLARTVQSVGYTGTLALDYRGDGDPVPVLLKARAALEAALGPEAARPAEAPPE